MEHLAKDAPIAPSRPKLSLLRGSMSAVRPASCRGVVREALEMRETVLVVEDDPANAILIEAILREIGGFEVIVTEDGDRVLDLVSRGAVSAAVMDISLGGTRVGDVKVDGVELTQRIRRLDGGGRFPVVLLSAHAMRGDAHRFLFASGANDYVTKPILDPEDFVQRVHRQIEAAGGADTGQED